MESNLDVLVVQECEQKDEWDRFSDWEWVGDNKNSGVCVFTRNGIKIEKSELLECGSGWFVMVKTSSIDVLGVWSKDDGPNKLRYIGGVLKVLRDNKELLSGDIVVLGDFNWNVNITADHPILGNFDDVLDVLNNNSLYSAYHRGTGENFGEESQATFFMHRKEDKSYHIDYIFAPDTYIDNGVLKIGSYNEWAEYSDHVPLFLDISD